MMMETLLDPFFVVYDVLAGQKAIQDRRKFRYFA
jgi:hypothetical protein